MSFFDSQKMAQAMSNQANYSFGGQMRHFDPEKDQLRQDNAQLRKLVEEAIQMTADLERRLKEKDANGLEMVTNHLKFLISVCHPDHNQGKEKEATIITQWLLKLRDK